MKTRFTLLAAAILFLFVAWAAPDEGMWLLTQIEKLPFTEMQKLWQFLGVTVEPGLETAVTTELASNPDEEWQAKRNDSIASFLPKGKAGNWRNMFTRQDQQVFKETAGEMLIKWGYEKDLSW